MTDPVVQEVPEEIVETGVLALPEMNADYWAVLDPEEKDTIRGEIGAVLAAAYPAIRKEIESEYRERLLGDQASIDAVAKKIAERERWNWNHADVVYATRARALDYLQAALVALSDTQEAQGG